MFFVLYAAFLVYMLKKFRYQIHMLQLNSYRNERYFKWLTQKRSHMFSLLSLIPLLAYLDFFVMETKSFSSLALGEDIGGISFVALGAILYLVLFIFSPKTQMKKPLVYTPRVRRLIAALAVVMAVIGALLWFVPLSYTLAILVIVDLLHFLLVLLANTINIPIENSVNRYYYNDAKRILASMPNLTVIGVTGSYGKTSTKYILQKLLSAKYNVLMTPESYNTPMGVIRTVRTYLNATHEIFIVEMGAKNPGDIKEICDLVNPDYGIISSIGPQHLETFKTMDAICRTKFELAQAAKKKVFLNINNEYIAREAGKHSHISYAIGEAADFTASNICVGPTGSDFVVTRKDGQSQKFHTKMLGDINVLNICGAIAAANTLGVEMADLAPAVRLLEAAPHRLQLIDGAKYTIIDDAFNSNPQGSSAALEVLKSFSAQRILVTPGMVELGEKQYDLNFELGRHAAGCCDFIVLVGPEQTAPIADGLKKEGYLAEKLYVAQNLQDALAKVNEIAQSGAVVLLENDLPDNFL